MNALDAYKKFYEEEFHHGINDNKNFDKEFYPELQWFIKEFDLYEKKVLEIGSANGKFQDIVRNYTGIDIVENLKHFYHKPYFIIKPFEKYPFNDEIFDAIFSYAVLEHIPDLENALLEHIRVLKRDGVMLLHPAWQVRSWASGGYEIKPYSALNWQGKIIKLSIPIRNNLLFRLFYVIPKRIHRTLKFLITRNKNYSLNYKKLQPNYEKFLFTDSDACNHIDPHAAILWFYKHGCVVTNYPNLLSAFFVRSGPLIIQKTAI